MTDSAPLDPDTLTDHFRTIERERMRGLPIVNARIAVEAVGFRELGEHRFGILIAPWFMNMVLLPGTDEWASLDQGTSVNVTLPAGEYEFTVTRDEATGENYLSAILFRTVADFPDQTTARAIAEDIIERLYTEPEEPPANKAKRMSRRSLLSGRGAT